MGWQWGTMALTRTCPKCGVSYESTPHRFEVVLSVQGYHGHFTCRDFTGGGSFRACCNFVIARRGLRWRELSEHNETKIYLKYFGVIRHGLKRRELRSTID
jgi:hypothetical protein